MPDHRFYGMDYRLILIYELCKRKFLAENSEIQKEPQRNFYCDYTMRKIEVRNDRIYERVF